MNTILDSGDSRRKALDTLRSKIAAAAEHLDEIREAPRTVDETVGLFMAAIADEREVARVRMQYFVHEGEQVQAPPASLGLLDLLLGPGELEKRTRAYFAGIVPEGALSRAEREKQASAAAKKLEQLRVEELDELAALERQELLVDWPADLDILALLERWDRAE